MSYDEIYMRRLNRFGNDYKTRIIGERQKVFENYLLKSVYRVDFIYNIKEIPGILETNKQDETQTLHYLLTRLEDIFDPGTVLTITDNNWLILWLEETEASGYNRYVVLKVDTEIYWEKDGNKYRTSAYFEGPGKSFIKDFVQSESKKTRFAEDLSAWMFIMPYNPNLVVEDYIEIRKDENTIKSFKVTGVDIFSTPGIQYVSLNPEFKRDHTKAPEYNPTEDSEEDFYWLNGGNINGST